MIERYDFMYLGQKLSDYGMVLCAPDSEPAFTGRTVDKGALTPHRDVVDFYNVQYSDTLIMNLKMIKDPCTNFSMDDFTLTWRDVHTLRSWLESSSDIVPLSVITTGDLPDVFFYGTFTDVQPFLNGQECVGLSAVFTCNAPYGFSNEVEFEIDVLGTKNSLTTTMSQTSALGYSFYEANLVPASNKWLFPIIEIHAMDGEAFAGTEVINLKSTDGFISKITLPAGKSCVTIDCAKKIVFDENNTIIPLSELGVVFEGEVSSVLSSNYIKFDWLKLRNGDDTVKTTVTNPAKVNKIILKMRYKFLIGGV